MISHTKYKLLTGVKLTTATCTAGFVMYDHQVHLDSSNNERTKRGNNCGLASFMLIREINSKQESLEKLR